MLRLDHPTELLESAERLLHWLESDFKTGSVRLREDRGAAYWQGFYRDDVVNEAGKTERKRIAVTLGSLKDIPNEKIAR